MPIFRYMKMPFQRPFFITIDPFKSTYSFNSLIFGGFNYIAIATDSILGIGLEMFLGKDAPYYQHITHKFPQYMHQRFPARLYGASSS